MLLKLKKKKSRFDSAYFRKQEKKIIFSVFILLFIFILILYLNFKKYFYLYKEKKFNWKWKQSEEEQKNLTNFGRNQNGFDLHSVVNLNQEKKSSLNRQTNTYTICGTNIFQLFNSLS